MGSGPRGPSAKACRHPPQHIPRPAKPPPRGPRRSGPGGPPGDPTVGVGGGGLRAMPPLQEPAAGDGGAEEELELSCGSPGEECYDAAWPGAPGPLGFG